jgi:hypothetical protein
LADLKLVLLHPEHARYLTEQQLGWLSLGLRGDPRGSLQGLLDDIELEAAQLWSVSDDEGGSVALLVTRIFERELCCTFEIQICVGSGLRDWLHLLPELEQHARNLGCKMVEMIGRPGWQRVLPQYRMRGVALEREL